MTRGVGTGGDARVLLQPWLEDVPVDFSGESVVKTLPANA